MRDRTCNNPKVATANTVTNLVTQYTTISASTQMPDILTAATQVMYPNAPANVQVVVSLVSIDKNGNATIAWSQTLHGTARTVGAAVTVPAALDIPNTNVVLGETTYNFTPSYGRAITGTMPLSDQIYLQPRQSNAITRSAS